MAVNDGTSGGFPFVNFAMNARSTQTAHGSGRTAIAVPRLKYTYIVDFQLNPFVIGSSEVVTNLREFMTNGKIHTPLKSIDFPQVNIEVEKLRSYNKYVNVPTKVEYPTSSIVFHDDSASIAMALWKEYWNFYHYTGSIGVGIETSSNLLSVSENNNFSLGQSLIGDNARSGMDMRPSLGLKLRTNSTKYFFENITIYDLGTEPDSVNIHYYYHPVIESFTHDNYDVEDRSSKMTFTLSFGFEGYYTAIGQSRDKIRDIIGSVLDFVYPGTTTPSMGHGKMVIPESVIQGPYSNPFPNLGSPEETNVLALNPDLTRQKTNELDQRIDNNIYVEELPDYLESEINRYEQQIQNVNKFHKEGRFTDEQAFDEITVLRMQQDILRERLDKVNRGEGRRKYSLQQNANTKSAAENTANVYNPSARPPVETIPNTQNDAKKAKTQAAIANFNDALDSLRESRNTSLAQLESAEKAGISAGRYLAMRQHVKDIDEQIKIMENNLDRYKKQEGVK